MAELSDELIDRFFSIVRLLSGAGEEGMDTDGSFVDIKNGVSKSIPQHHVHIVPRFRHDGLKRIFWAGHRYSDEDEINRAKELLRSSVERLNE